jgi:hypothetical protein
MGSSSKSGDIMNYLKNTAGQFLYFTIINASDGSALTSAVSGYRTIDNGTQAAVTGTLSHKGNGQWQLAMSQADTNGDNIGFLFTHASGIPVSINIVTDDGSLATAANQTTLLSRLTATRAGYLDNLTNLDAAISSRSSHGDPDPNNYIDAAISSRSSHNDPDPNGYIDAAISSVGGGGGGDATAANQTTIIGYVDALEARLTAARAGYLDNLTNLDAAISSRSSHGDPDPNGYIDAAISSVSSGSVLTDVLEGTMTVEEALRLILAAVAGLSNGGGTNTLNFRDLANSKNRLQLTVDADGNRTAVTADGS